MNTGIITFNDTNNFGSLLQTYALYQVIRDRYSQCEIINYRCKNLYDREIPKHFYQLRTPKDFYRYTKYHREQQKKYKELTAFANTNMFLSPVLTKENVADYCRKYDKIIVGSDIVWGLDITGEDYTYFLDFMSRGEKYAYASSFGSDYIMSDPRKKKVGDLLRTFKLIAVRENDACACVRAISGKDAYLVLDPTLLLSSAEWEKYVSCRLIKEPYILTYFEDEQGVVRNTAIKLSAQTGLSVYNITNGKNMEGVKNISAYSIEDFLSYIFFADLVITSSYHGMAFSINFNKQFYFFNRCHKSRMDTLASIARVENRELKKNELWDSTDINYLFVNDNISEWRKKSFNYLNKVFCNDENSN